MQVVARDCGVLGQVLDYGHHHLTVEHQIGFGFDFALVIDAIGPEVLGVSVRLGI